MGRVQWIGLLLLFFSIQALAQSKLAPFTQKQQEKLESLTALLSDSRTDEGRFDLYKKIAKHTYIRKPGVAQAYIDSIFLLAREQKDSTYYYEATMLKAFKLHRHASFNNAIEAFLRAIKFLEQQGDITKTSRCYYFLGDSYFQIGSMDKAIASLLTCIRISKEFDLEVEEQLSNIKLGRVYRELGKFDLSLEHLDWAEKLHKDAPKIRNMRRLVNTLMNKGQTLAAMNNWDAAIKACEKVKTIIGDGPLKPQFHIAQSFLSDAYLEKGNLEMREACALDAMEYFDQFKVNHQGMAKARKNRAKIFLRKGDLDEAREMSQEMLVIAQENKMLFKELIARELLLDVEEASKNYQQALLHSKEVGLLKDSILNLASNAKIQELTIAFDTEQKNEQIKRLALEDELKAARLFNQRIWIWGLLIGLSLLSFLLVKYNKQNKEIASQNATIHDNLKEKELLLMEVHHRVKNNLQMISSLLSLQSRSLSDAHAIEALEEGQSRIASMALIHQHLYTEDNLTGVKMKDYVSNLCQRVFESHDISLQKVRLDLEIDDVQLDIATVVPIGLILNELITNACKYAFPHERDGVLSVRLHEENDKLILSVSDDGVGYKDRNPPKGFGSRLIQTFAKKMDAEVLEFHDNGYRIDFQIKYYIKS